VTKRFEEAMRLMRRRGQDAEDGFGMIEPHAAEHLDELFEAFRVEQKHGLRCWLLELIGHARDPRALPLLVEQLASDDESLRYWAICGLERLGTKEARVMLYRHRTNNTR